MEFLTKLNHVLFLENEIWGEQQIVMPDMVALFESYAIKCTVIDMAASKKDEIAAILPTVDAICFESTFIYSEDVKSIGDLLKSIPKPLLVFGYHVGGSNGLKTIIGEVERLWSLDELAKMSHHTIFQITHVMPTMAIRLEKDWYEEIPLSKYKTLWDQKEVERIKTNKGFYKTGRKVKIKDILACGRQFENLISGEVVPELDCKSIDDNPDRGTWVMGVDEPVKLLNSDGYDEWEYDQPNYRDLVLEFYTKANKRTDPNDTMKTVQDWVKNCSGKLKLSDGDLWIWCDELCNILSVERRGFRNYFYNRLEQHRERFVYFKDPA